MSIVRINAITVPEGSGDELLKRFEARLGEGETLLLSLGGDSLREDHCE